jgi:hypothetical protein
MKLTDGYIDFHSNSWIDPFGRLFWQDGNLYRGIRSNRSHFYRNLFEKGTIQRLAEKRLIADTWVMDLSTDEFPLIVQHEIVPIISYPSEWCASQLKAAAIHILDLEMELREFGLTLLDINPWNMLFVGTQPLYVDFCSISPLSDANEWSSRDQFEEFFLNPLLLAAQGLMHVVRRLLFDPWIGIKPLQLERMGINNRRKASRAKTLASAVIPPGLRPFAKKAALRIGTGPKINVAGELLALRQTITNLDVLGPKTQWGGYYVENYPEFTASSRWSAKHRAVHEALLRAKPQSVIDIGSNRGWYAQLAARHGARVIASDSDETSVNELYADAKKTNANIVPIYMDVRFPEPGQGPAYKMHAPASQRFKSEMVLALAIIHHLVFTWHLTFDQAVEMFAMFASKWLAVEFVGPGDDVVQRWKQANYQWYTSDTFLKSLSKRFEIVAQLPSDTGGLDSLKSDRTLILCQKKSV